MLKHNLIIDRLSEAQKISILTDVRCLCSDEYLKLGIPAFNVSSVEGYNQESYQSPTSLANSWNMRVISELANDIAVGMYAQDINAAYTPSPIAKLNLYDKALTEDPYLSSRVAAEYLYAIGKTGIAVVLDGALLDETDVSRLDKRADPKFINEFVIRALRNTVVNKKCNGVVVGADIDVKGYEKINSEIIDGITNGNGTAFQNAYVLCKNIAPEETVSRIVCGHICLDGSEVVLKAAIDRYKRLKSSIKDGKVSLCELDAEIDNGNAFPPEKIDEAVDRVLEFVFECARENRGRLTSYAVSSSVIKNAAYESTVLLKNDNNILPLKNGTVVAFVGDILVNYNGENSDNSSKANELAYYIRNQGCAAQGFWRGYSMGEDRSESLLYELNASLANVQTVLLFMGTNPKKERAVSKTENLYLPANQLAVLEKIREMGKKVIAVVSSDLAFDVSFEDKVDALILAPLNAKYGAEAVVDVITGRLAPTGKLAYSLYKDTERVNIKHKFYVDMPNARVGTFLGYRYYDSADYDVAYPFGFGLGYSSFVYSNLTVQGSDVVFTVKNKGNMAGAEIAQVYLGLEDSKRQRPKKELVGFEKIMLQAGASATVRISLANLETFDVESGGWICEKGEYTVYVAASVRDVRLSEKVILGNTILTPTAERASDYLQSETNIISERYTLEADYKLMKRNIRNIIFGAGALVLAVAMFLFSLISGNVGIFFNVIAAILAIAGIVLFALEGSDRQKLHKEERDRINEANKQNFADAQNIAGFSTAEIFVEEFDKAANEAKKAEAPIQVKNDNYLEYVNDSLTFDSAAEQFVAFAASRGYKFEINVAREIFAAMSASRLIITKGMTNDSFAAFVKVLSEYFGTQPCIDAVDSSYVNDNSALFRGIGAVKQRTQLSKALELAPQAKEKVQIAALTDVTFTEMSNYFVPFARYARNPRNTASIEAVGENEQPVIFNFSENLWFFINLRMGESLKNIPAYISELASVIRVDYSGAVPMMLMVPLMPFSYYQFDYMLEKIKAEHGIPEEIWKRIDALVAFINNSVPYALGNRACIAIERFYSVFSACGGEAAEGIDRAISARVVPSAIVALNDVENTDDKNLSEKLEMIFGEDNVEVCRSNIRSSGSTVL